MQEKYKRLPILEGTKKRFVKAKAEYGDITHDEFVNILLDLLEK